LIIFVPYALFYELKSKKASQLEAALPNFLKSLSSASRSGLTLSRAMRVTSTSELGALTDEVRRAGKEIEWGSSATEALAKLEQRVAVSPVTTRTLTLIRKASEAEEDISGVVEIALNDVKTSRHIIGERSTAMFIYKAIIVMCFFIFLITVYFIVGAYVGVSPEVISPETGYGEMQVAAPEAHDVKILFYRMLWLQAVFGGLISGQMGGDIRRGVKYAVLLSIAAAFIFELAIMPKVAPPPVIEN
jgi:flagellar protein FlaJ